MGDEGSEGATATTWGGRSNQGRAIINQRRRKRLLILAPAAAALCVVLILVAGFYSNIHSDAVLATMPLTLRQCFLYDSYKRAGEGVGGGLDPWIKPPSTVTHSMTDQELFWRATMVPTITTFPFTRVPKVAFLFLTKGSLPLAPLWDSMLKGNEPLFSLYVHSPPSSSSSSFPSSSVFHQRFIPSQETEWGRMSICDAERRLLGNALLDISNQRFVLVSESCIPLHNFSFIYRHLMGSPHSFVGVFDDPGPHGRGRYSPHMAPQVNLSQWRKGAQWFDMDRAVAIMAISDSVIYTKFAAFCRPACYVDEHYFPTMLTLTAGPLLANRSVTWVDWSRGGAHPSTFHAKDVTIELLLGMKRKLCNYSAAAGHSSYSSSCSLFARKFSPSSLQPLLLLSPKVLGF